MVDSDEAARERELARLNSVIITSSQNGSFYGGHVPAGHGCMRYQVYGSKLVVVMDACEAIKFATEAARLSSASAPDATLQEPLLHYACSLSNQESLHPAAGCASNHMINGPCRCHVCGCCPKWKGLWAFSGHGKVA